MIDKPSSYTLTEGGASQLLFPDNTSGLYYITGGIAWPTMIMTSQGPKIEGYALMCAQNVNSGRIYIAEERVFKSVENVISYTEQGKRDIVTEGVAGFFNTCGGQYGARRWFWKGQYETARQWIVQMHRSEVLNPKPSCIQIEWENDMDALALVWQAFSSDLMEGVEGTQLEEDQERFAASIPGTPLPPSLQALCAAVVGIRRFPYRPENEEKPELVYVRRS